MELLVPNSPFATTTMPWRAKRCYRSGAPSVIAIAPRRYAANNAPPRWR